MASRILIPAALLGLSPLAMAGTWSGEAGLGYLATDGNSETSLFNAKLEADYKADKWKNAFAALAINSAEQGDSTAERYLVSDQLDYDLSDVDYAFGRLEFEKDLFGGIRQRTSETVGYGRHLLVGPEHLLDAEIGAGVRQQELQDTGEKTDEAIGRVALKYLWNLSPTSSFGQAVKAESGEENTYIESVTELKANISGNLFAVISYTVKHNTDVPATTDKTDTFTAVSLAYTFGEKAK